MLFGFITESEAMSEFVDQEDFDSLEGSLRDIDEIFINCSR